MRDPDEAALMLTTHFLPGRSGVKGEVNCACLLSSVKIHKEGEFNVSHLHVTQSAVLFGAYIIDFVLSAYSPHGH